MTSDIENLSHEEALDIIRRLAGAFKFVDEVMTRETDDHQIYVVSGTGPGAPGVTTFADVPSLCKFITEKRAAQNAAPDVRHYMHIFCGKRWTIQKGRVWQLFDGKQLIPIEGGDLPPVLDDSGSLYERVDLDRVLAANDEAQPEEPAHTVQVRPATLGRVVVDEDDEDSAPAGRDPEIT